MADLDLQPTQQMADNAARGLELREKHGKGGTAVGVARARDIKNRKNLSPETVKRMHSFFSRHEGNQAGGEDDAGYIAWLLWGGDAGKAWAARKAAQIDKSESARLSHDIRLPKGKRRLNIDEAHAALAQMGYRLGTVRYDPAAGGSVYKVSQPNGSVIDMPAAKLTDFIYEKAKNMKSRNLRSQANTYFSASSNQALERKARSEFDHAHDLISRLQMRKNAIPMQINTIRRWIKEIETAKQTRDPELLHSVSQKAYASEYRWFGHFSRLGEKIRFQVQWTSDRDKQADDYILRFNKLIDALEQHSKSIDKAIAVINRHIKTLTDAVRMNNSEAVYDVAEAIHALEMRITRGIKVTAQRPGAKAKFQKLSEHMNHIVALCDKVLAVLYRESPDKSLGGVWAKTAQDVHEIKATAHQISRQSWAYSRPGSAAKFSSNPYIAAAMKKAQHLRLLAKDLIAALSSGNKDEARRVVSAMRYGVENIDTHIKAFMSRPGAKTEAAKNQVDLDPRSEDNYEWVHRRRPKGRGSWAFIAPNESLVFVPGQMTYSEAKKWLKENAPMSGRYKVATQRPGSAAKFGQVGEMLSQIESQSHDQRDLAKSNLRKLAAKIADIDHTREEWDRYVRVAKSLGYTESQIAGFSRAGAKTLFEKSDDYARILMQPVTPGNCGKISKTASEAIKYAKSVGDDDLLELAEEVAFECKSTKSRASRKEAR